MWNSEDAQRYQGLTQWLQNMAIHADRLPAEQRVVPEHLALYLEWFELAREAAPSIRPFLDKCSPYTLCGVSYQQLANDFRWLATQMQPGQDV